MNAVRACLAPAMLVLCLVASARADTTWLELRSPNFRAVGNVGERQLREVVTRFEQFRAFFGSALPGARLTPPVPMTIVVFDRLKTQRPFSPLYQGRPREVAGMFLRGPDAIAITVNLEAGVEAYATSLHEYTHLLVSNTMPGAPVWFNEGLAELYENFELGTDRASVGRPHVGHVRLLRERRIPLAELLAVTRDSPLYNEAERASIFYAESWAFVHYLMLGNRERSGQLHGYLTRLNGGEPSKTAFPAAFGVAPEVLDKELMSYINGIKFTSAVYDLDGKAPSAGALRATRLRQDDVEPTLADLLTLLQRPDEAVARLSALLARDAGHGAGRAALARVLLLQQRTADALVEARRAVEAAPDDEAAQRTLAAVGLRRLHETFEPDAALVAETRAAATRAVALAPATPRSHALLAYALLVEPSDVAGARKAADTAMTLLPTEDHQLLLAQVLGRQGEPRKARDMLGQLVARGSSDEVKRTAREALAVVANAQITEQRRLERAEQERAAALRAREDEASRASAQPGGSGAAAAGPAQEPPATTDNRRRPGFTPLFRRTAPGETRTYALYTSTECVPGSDVALVVRIDGVTRRFFVDGFGHVDFITYRSKGGRVTCGERLNPPLPVYLTWKPLLPDEPRSKRFAGQAIAVEILPEDFVPQ